MVAQLVEYCATSRNVVGSIPNSVIGIFQWHNPSGHPLALGSTQPPTEMGTRNISWGIKAAGAYGWQPCHLHVPIVLKLGALSSWNVQGLFRSVMGLLYLLCWISRPYRMRHCQCVSVCHYCTGTECPRLQTLKMRHYVPMGPGETPNRWHTVTLQKNRILGNNAVETPDPACCVLSYSSDISFCYHVLYFPVDNVRVIYTSKGMSKKFGVRVIYRKIQ
jgi:hypothetical protein